jgi:hypothetical protein
MLILPIIDTTVMSDSRLTLITCIIITKRLGKDKHNIT